MDNTTLLIIILLVLILFGGGYYGGAAGGSHLTGRIAVAVVPVGTIAAEAGLMDKSGTAVDQFDPRISNGRKSQTAPRDLLRAGLVF
jgi:hypothetical protein